MHYAEWFHGDAFGLDEGNIPKIIGFRCHLCRKRTPPVCPHVPAMGSPETQKVEVEHDVGIEFSKEATEAVPRPNRDHQCSLPVGESVHWKEQLGTVMDSRQRSVSESMLIEENEHIHGNGKENSDALRTSSGTLKPDLLTSSNENSMLEEHIITSGDAIVTSHDEAQPSSCRVDADVIETELASLGPEVTN